LRKPLRRLAVLALPEIDEAEDLVGLLALAYIGVGVAEHLGIGILAGRASRDTAVGHLRLRAEVTGLPVSNESQGRQTGTVNVAILPT
jgi:hypothetical protein